MSRCNQNIDILEKESIQEVFFGLLISIEAQLLFFLAVFFSSHSEYVLGFFTAEGNIKLPRAILDTGSEDKARLEVAEDLAALLAAIVSIALKGELFAATLIQT